MKKICNYIKDNILYVIFYVFIIILIILIEIDIHKYNKIIENDFTTPVERIRVDTIYITRDSIINNVKYIKVIQHDTIEKVYNLSNDSTIDLFYKLVSE